MNCFVVNYSNVFKKSIQKIKMIKANNSGYVSGNILEEEEIVRMVEMLKREGKKVGLCMGGFDLLHPGHMTHFVSAKESCDVLIVGVSSDDHQVKRKGDGRPIYPEQLRAFTISQMKPVDYVFISYSNDAVKHIKEMKPTHYIKGSDYNAERMTPGIVKERAAVSEIGGEMVYTTDEKLATSEIIKYIKDEFE
jgi:rfaE bifunctional protein nucleotidyltransferase chain/domain